MQQYIFMWLKNKLTEGSPEKVNRFLNISKNKNMLI